MSELPEQPEGGEDAENQAADDDTDEMEDAGRATFVAEEFDEVEDLRQAVEGIELDSFHSEDLELAQHQAVENPGVVVAGPPHAPLAAANAAVHAAVEHIADQPTERQQWNTQRFIAIFGGIGGIAGALAAVYTIIKAETGGSSDANVPINEDIKKKIRDLVAKWWSRSDTDYWGDFATAADDPKLALTLEDQILFVNYTIDLSPVTPWIWRSGDDVMKVVNQLRAVYASSGSTTSAMYRLVPTLTYQDTATGKDVPLPRAVAATVLRTALSIILINPTLPPQHAPRSRREQN